MGQAPEIGAKRARVSSVSSDVYDKPRKIATSALVSQASSVVRCELPPHNAQDFSDISAYELHYIAEHTNRCSECGNNFPTAHLLGLHIAEEHDPIVAARREAGEKTFGCFVETCNKVCSDWKKRRSHLVDKHSFPRNYDFFIVRSGIDGLTSLLRPGVDVHGHRQSSRERRSSASTRSVQLANLTSTVSGPVDENVNIATLDSASTVPASPLIHHGSRKASDIEALSDSMSAMRLVPRAVQLRRKQRRHDLDHC